MSTKSEYALSLFTNGYNCAQSVLIAMADEIGIDNRMAFRIASGLGGGVGRSQNICGAINAGAIVLSMKFGKHAAQSSQGKDAVAKLVGEFVGHCQKMLGTVQCEDLLQLDALNVEESKKEGIKPNICTDAVVKVTELVESYLTKELTY